MWHDRGMAKKRPLSKPKRLSKSKYTRINEQELRPMIREAARAGLVEAIEHCQNFWNVSDGYKNYIEQQIELQSEVLMTAVKTALREELARADLLDRWRPPQGRKR